MLPGISGLTVIVGLLWVKLTNICGCSLPPSQEYLHIEMIGVSSDDNSPRASTMPLAL